MVLKVVLRMLDEKLWTILVWKLWKFKTDLRVAMQLEIMMFMYGLSQKKSQNTLNVHKDEIDWKSKNDLKSPYQQISFVNKLETLQLTKTMV